MIENNSLPVHIAIIMDGNGRWARQRRLPRNAGHRVGIKRVKEVIKAAREIGIRVLTLFTFSTENWNRPQKEIDMLMGAMERFLNKEIRELHKNNIRFMTIGKKGAPIPESLQKSIEKATALTKENSGLIVNLAFNYGSRSEIVDAVREIAVAVKEGSLKIPEINEEVLSASLYTSGLPDPDLLIRTSGEERISNFLLWQCSYSEFYFTKKFWPDFGAEDFKKAIMDFQKRERRFGEVKQYAS